MGASTTTNKISTRQSTNKARSVHHKKSSIKHTNALSQRTASSNNNNKDRGSISFNEMCRLMSTYGSTKCLRKRKASTSSSNNNNNGQSTAKIESTKRKFYRWFPNLESRFTRNPTTGRYEPNIGHEAEIQYRLDMRKKDGQVLSKKRAKCRKERNTGVVGVSRTTTTTTSSAFKAPKIITPSTSTISDTSSHRISPVVTPHMMNNNMIIPSGIMSSSSSLPLYNGTTATASTQAVNYDDEYLSSSMNFGYVPMPPPSPSKKNNSKVSPLIHSNVAPHSTSTAAAFGEEPMPDRSFIAEHGIFDDVERTFYGVEDDVEQEQEMLLPLSSMIEERGDSSSWSSSSSSDNRSSPTSSIDEMIDKSIEECCEEIFKEDESLVRGDSAGYLFDIIS